MGWVPDYCHNRFYIQQEICNNVSIRGDKFAQFIRQLEDVSRLTASGVPPPPSPGGLDSGEAAAA